MSDAQKIAERLGQIAGRASGRSCHTAQHVEVTAQALLDAGLRELVEAGNVECDKCVLTEDCKGIWYHCAACQRRIVERYFRALAALKGEKG